MGRGIAVGIRILVWNLVRGPPAHFADLRVLRAVRRVPFYEILGLRGPCETICRASQSKG